METNKRYLIDLSQAQSPADVVFELSKIMEQGDASDKEVWLKLGNINLNQSQLLSIKSLINSINSNLSLIESESEQTELAAATLGISTKGVEEEMQAELQKFEEEANKNFESEPSEQYIPMTDHIEEEDSTEKEETSTEKSANTEEESNNNEEEKSETENQEETKTEQVANDPLDSIFDSEVKLENILSEEKDLNESKNWPLAKEFDEIEIPTDEMTDEDYEILRMNTQYHKQTVRSGQVIKSNGNVVIIGDCHPGCEIHAAGDITVWGVLGGIAHAGCKGNTKAKIRALNLNAIQLRIADSFARRPDHIKNIYVEKTNTFTPEEARNINGSIVILKINDR